MLGDFLDVPAVIHMKIRGFEYTLKVELKEFADGLDVRSNVKMGKKSQRRLQVWGLRNWERSSTERLQNAWAC